MGISSGAEKHLDTVQGESYIYISLFEGEARPGKADGQLVG
jgi:hypothetical protein